MTIRNIIRLAGFLSFVLSLLFIVNDKQSIGIGFLILGLGLEAYEIFARWNQTK